MKVLAILLLVTGVARAQAPPPVSLLDVPYISQSEALCGGAAAAMVLRYWGARGLDAESFAHLVDRSASGIRTDALAAEIAGRGWQAREVAGDERVARAELAAGRPVLALIEDRPGAYHYVVVVAWQERGVVFHDPARAPFRVMAREEFERRWRAADSWMLLVAPTAKAPADARGSADVPAPPALDPGPVTSCDELVASGVTAAQRQDLVGAERALTQALSCPGAAAPRELAGVRVLQRRWPEAAELARAATAADPADAYAWKLLATSRFVQDDRAGALAAWNRAGEPRVDLVRVDGLARTRHRVVERLLGIDTGALLTPRSFERARRRLAELPAAAAARLEYVPVQGGLTEVRAAVSERAAAPATRTAFAAMALHAAVRREARVTLASLSGGGEQIGAAWRFWPRRPLLAAHVAAPAPWGGVWWAAVEGERQPFDRPEIAAVRRRGGRAGVADWLTGALRLEATGGVEQRDDSGRFGIIGAAVTVASSGNRLVARATGDRWLGGGQGFGIAGASVELRSRTEPRGIVFVGTAAAQRVGRRAPLDLWPAGDTGDARPTLLRAHPVLDEGRLRTERLGRTLVAATIEGQRWWEPVRLVRAGAAVFLDVARTADRLTPGERTDADAGAGLRVGIIGIPGVFRVDVARGLRDGDAAISVAYVP